MEQRRGNEINYTFSLFYSSVFDLRIAEHWLTPVKSIPSKIVLGIACKQECLYDPFTKLTDKFLFTVQQSGSQFSPYTTYKFLTFKSVCNGKVILVQFEEYF